MSCPFVPIESLHGLQSSYGISEHYKCVVSIFNDMKHGDQALSLQKLMGLRPEFLASRSNPLVPD